MSAIKSSRRPAILLWVIGVLVVLGLVADALLAAPAAEDAPPELQEAPASGVWYCPAAVGPDEAATLSIVAVGDTPSIVTVDRYPEGRPVPDDPVQLTPGDQLDIALAPGQAATPLRVRWLAGPAVASWRLESGDAAAANCADAPSPMWHLAALDTAGGARSFLHLFNPFSVDAIARVVFATPDGRVPLLLTDNVLVPAGRTLRMPLNEFQPEQADLGVSVQVLGGRLVALGEVLNATGRALVEAVPEPADELGFAFARAEDNAATWLSILNPNERDAAVEVRVSDPRPDAPGLGELTVPAGAVLRVDLAQLSEQPEFAVALASVNGQPVVAMRGTAIRSSAERRGFALSAGLPPTREWALPGGGTSGRLSRVALYNAGTEAVTASVRTAGGGLPEWEEIVLPPNGRASVQLEDFDDERDALGARVTASGPIITELRVLDRLGSMRLWSALGVPRSAWTGPARRAPARRDPALSGRPIPPPD
jgi:hypothetical protein